MVAQNLIFVTEVFLFIPNATEQEIYSNQNLKIEFGNSVNS